MALVLANRVKETSTTTGTGPLSLAGAVTGFQTFVDGIGTTNTTYYSITDESGNFEVGLGTVTDGTPDTLSRDTVLESSNSNALVNFGSGTKTIFVTQPAEKAVYVDGSDNVTLPGTLCVTDNIKSTTTCAGNMMVTCSGLARADTAGITYGAYGSHVFDSTNGYALHACCNAYALGPRAVKIDEPLDLCVGDCSYNSNSCSKLYGGVEAGGKGLTVKFLMNCSACCHHACFYTTEAYTYDSWHLEGHATGYIGTKGDSIRLQHGFGPIGACPMLDVRYTCTDVYVCCAQKLKVCNTGACTYGCHCASTCFNSPRVCGTSCVRSPRICGTTCVRTGTVCATSSTQSPYYFVNSAYGSSYDYWLPYCKGSAGQVLTVPASGTVTCFCNPQLGIKYVSGCTCGVNSLVLGLCEDWQQATFVIQSDFSCPGYVNNDPRFDEIHLQNNISACICFCYTSHTTGGDSCRSYINAFDIFPDTYVANCSILRYDFWRVPTGTGCFRVHMEGSYTGSGGAYTGVPQNDRVFMSGTSSNFVSSTYDCNWYLALCNNSYTIYQCWYSGCCPPYNCFYSNRCVEYALRTVLGAACTY